MEYSPCSTFQTIDMVSLWMCPMRTHNYHNTNYLRRATHSLRIFLIIVECIHTIKTGLKTREFRDQTYIKIVILLITLVGRKR